MKKTGGAGASDEFAADAIMLDHCGKHVDHVLGEGPAPPAARWYHEPDPPES